MKTTFTRSEKIERLARFNVDEFKREDIEKLSDSQLDILIQKREKSIERHGKITSVKESFIYTLFSLFNRAEEHCWTDKQIQEGINSWVFSTERYKKLPNWAQSEIVGALWVLRTQVDRKLVWTHFFNGERLDAYSSDAHEKLSGHYHEINTEESCHCWFKDGKFHAFDSKCRAMTDKENK